MSGSDRRQRLAGPVAVSKAQGNAGRDAGMDQPASSGSWVEDGGDSSDDDNFEASPTSGTEAAAIPPSSGPKAPAATPKADHPASFANGR